MSKLLPSHGGCWYCHTDDETGDWLFSFEFDTNVHRHCLEEALKKKDPNDWETRIMGKEFELLP